MSEAESPAEHPTEDPQRFRCAVVVFMDVRGVDQGDANNAAQRVVRHAVGEGDRGLLPATYPIPGTQHPRFEGADLSARVVEVMDLGVAAGNGFLWQMPTSKAWAQHGLTPLEAESENHDD